MLCPVCKTTQLLMTSREGIEIDYCPDCRGVWLDRGELDKLIEKSTQNTVLPTPPAPQVQNNYQRVPETQNYYPKQNPNHNQYPHDHRRKKKEGWFEDLFDF